MRIAELSETTGISVATLKFYLREGLLHSGTATAINQANYDASHVRRVKLVRALIDLGGLSLADVRRVVQAADDESLPIHEAFGIAQDAMASGHQRETEDFAAALEEADRFIHRHGLMIRPGAGVRTMLADAMVSLSQFGWCPPGVHDSIMFDSLVQTALENARFEMQMVPDDQLRAMQMEFTVVGTIAFDLAASAVRRMALEHASFERFGHLGPDAHPAAHASDNAEPAPTDSSTTDEPAPTGETSGESPDSASTDAD